MKIHRLVFIIGICAFIIWGCDEDCCPDPSQPDIFSLDTLTIPTTFPADTFDFGIVSRGTTLCLEFAIINKDVTDTISIDFLEFVSTDSTVSDSLFTVDDSQLPLVLHPACVGSFEICFPSPLVLEKFLQTARRDTFFSDDLRIGYREYGTDERHRDICRCVRAQTE